MYIHVHRYYTYTQANQYYTCISYIHVQMYIYMYMYRYMYTHIISNMSCDTFVL